MFTNFHSVWAINEQHEPAIRQAIEERIIETLPSVLGREWAGHPIVPTQVQAAAGFTIEGYYSDQLSIGPKNDVVVIPVTGMMARGWTWDNYFSNTFMMRLLASIAENDAKKGVIFDFNTGGGTVDSLDEFAASIQATMTKKPVVALANYCASAGYYVASQCSEVIMRQGPTAQIGSIGTILFYYDYSAAYEKAGIKPEIFRSSGSVDKAKANGVEPLDEQTRAEIQRMLDVCNKAFKGAVRAGRGSKLTTDAVFTGKMYGAQDAQKLGLIDRTGDLQTAYQRVISLSKQYA